MKRVLCILNSLNSGGAETFLMKVSRVLPKEKYQFDFIVCEDGGCYEQEILERGGVIHRIPMRTKNFFGAMVAIATVVRQNRYDSVLKLGNSPICVFDLIACLMGGARVLAMRSCNALTGLSLKNRILDAVLRPLLNLIANVKIAPSMLAAEYTFGSTVAHREVTILRNGVDLEYFRFDQAGREKIRQEFGCNDRLLVGHIGRFHEQKNHHFLLKVFAAILKRRPEAILLLIGTGELEAELRTLTASMGLSNHVIFAGTRFDIPQLLSAIDIFVFPSRYEGMPNTIIEAQATGLPCVLADTITPDADLTGLLNWMSLTDDPDAWAQKALDCVCECRHDTRNDLKEKGYDISSTAKHFAALLMDADQEGDSYVNQNEIL